jgi:hypothetical protein
MELYELKINTISNVDSGQNFWEATVHLPQDFTLHQFHLYIQDLVKFDNDHLYEFFSGRHERHRKVVYAEKAGYPMDGGRYESIQICELFPLVKGFKLYYHFDFGDDWLFQIKKSRKCPETEAGAKYPKLMNDNGVKLPQYNWPEEDDWE